MGKGTDDGPFFLCWGPFLGASYEFSRGDGPRSERPVQLPIWPWAPVWDVASSHWFPFEALLRIFLRLFGYNVILAQRQMRNMSCGGFFFVPQKAFLKEGALTTFPFKSNFKKKNGKL